MEIVKALIDGIEKEVYGLCYIYNSKYYFIYTEKEVDEKDYVILYMTQVGRETKNTENGVVYTGYTIGVEITDQEEQKKVQESISTIVEDKKNNTQNPLIQYLPISTLANLKIVSKKRFRLLKSIMQEHFKLEFENISNKPVLNLNNEQSNEDDINSNVIIDYRTKYFEMDEKNKQLQDQIDVLTQKLNDIKKVIE